MYIEEKNQSIASDIKQGVAKIDKNTLTIDEKGILSYQDYYITELLPQSIASDDQILFIINNYYNKKYSLIDIQSVQSVGDIRQANNTNHALFKVASHITPNYGANGGIQINYTMPEMSTVNQVIIDFNHDVLKEPIENIFNALITIQMLGTIGDAAEISGSSSLGGMTMNSTKTNLGGQTGSILYSYLNSNFYNACGFKDQIKTVKNPTKLTYNSDVLTECEDKIFLLSQTEVIGNNDGEGIQYNYYIASSHRKKYRGYEGLSGSDSYNNQQLRSIYSTNSTQFYYVTNNGRPYYYYADSSYAVSPACAL